MASLPNYLRTHRRRLALSQEEVAFLLGGKGQSKGSKVSRDENFVREPNLETALAYEAIYGKSVHELFAGVYERMERFVAERARVLLLRKAGKAKRQEILAHLASKAEA